MIDERGKRQEAVGVGLCPTRQRLIIIVLRCNGRRKRSRGRCPHRPECSFIGSVINAKPIRVLACMFWMGLAVLARPNPKALQNDYFHQ
jgi:hypothetical protein